MVSSTPVTLQERRQEEVEEGVSKLVMKSCGRGTARRRALIHSIPKFSQVAPPTVTPPPCPLSGAALSTAGPGPESSAGAPPTEEGRGGQGFGDAAGDGGSGGKEKEAGAGEKARGPGARAEKAGAG